ncbi:MAG: toll/interleukin-1 receptor domain-containing protein [Oculatellaceae cyanobacterium bins.114]|nr:toll/interleukin-1 receptor domain-containing protein [Oculatellaceae cyanobacterium bins.114]
MKVFISYANPDKELATRVTHALKASGFQVWDDSQILPGENWRESIATALQESDAIVVLLTPSSVHSPTVTQDIGYALGKQDYKGKLIPVVAASTEQLPQEEIPWILKRLRMIHIPNLEDDEEGLREITQALKAVA